MKSLGGRVRLSLDAISSRLYAKHATYMNTCVRAVQIHHTFAGLPGKALVTNCFEALDDHLDQLSRRVYDRPD